VQIRVNTAPIWFYSCRIRKQVQSKAEAAREENHTTMSVHKAEYKLTVLGSGGVGKTG